MMKISYFRMCGCGGDGMEVKERIIRLIEQIDDSTVLRRIIYLCVPGMALI
jgi:coenzyme F420-reducing hydrogenase gamma subunit